MVAEVVFPTALTRVKIDKFEKLVKTNFIAWNGYGSVWMVTGLDYTNV